MNGLSGISVVIGLVVVVVAFRRASRQLLSVR